MPFSRESMITAMLDLVDASADARKAMSGVERSILEGVDALVDGADVLECLCTSRVREHREDLEESLRRVTKTRHRFRLVLVAQCAGAGMNAREISELWGFSRQRLPTR